MSFTIHEKCTCFLLLLFKNMILDKNVYLNKCLRLKKINIQSLIILAYLSNLLKCLTDVYQQQWRWNI